MLHLEHLHEKGMTQLPIVSDAIGQLEHSTALGEVQVVQARFRRVRCNDYAGIRHLFRSTNFSGRQLNWIKSYFVYHTFCSTGTFNSSRHGLLALRRFFWSIRGHILFNASKISRPYRGLSYDVHTAINDLPEVMRRKYM
jgi:hypothetical protein